MRRTLMVLMAVPMAAGLTACAEETAAPDGTPSPTAETHVVAVFFGAPGAADTDCALVQAVERTTDGPDVLHDAVAALLEGPTAEEQADELWSFFSDETAGVLISAEVDEGVARLDFEDFSGIIPNASSSCGSASLLAQLDATATQFPTVGQAVYSFEGSEEAFYGWLQMEPPE